MVANETVKVNKIFPSAENEVGPYYKTLQNLLLLLNH